MSSFVIEEERGTYAKRELRHDGYWAGDFAEPASPAVLEAWFRWGRAQAAALGRMPRTRCASN